MNDDGEDGFARAAADGATILEYSTARAKKEAADQERARLAAERKEKAEAERRKTHPRFEDFVSYTEAELEKLPLEPPNWLVPDLIHGGLSNLSAQPKIGKSFMMTALCRAVATGTLFANWKPSIQGNVLYLDLEGTIRRAQSRQKIVRGDWAYGVDEFRTMFEFAQMDEGGLEDLEKAIALWHPALIVIDVWADFRPAPKKGEAAYAYDRRTTKPLKDLAKQHKITIILMHHNRKQSDPDFTQQVSGSTGITSGPDGITTITRARGEEEAILELAGRDLPNGELKLAMKFAHGLWTILGPAEEHFAVVHRDMIDGFMSAAGHRDIAFREICDETELPAPRANRVLKQLVKDGLVVKVKRGVYKLANPIG